MLTSYFLYSRIEERVCKNTSATDWSLKTKHEAFKQQLKFQVN